MTEQDKAGYQRSFPRETVRIKTRFLVNGQWHDCLVTNISTVGVRLYLRILLEVGKGAALELPGLGQQKVRVIWSDGNEAGLEFENELDDLSGLLQ